MCVMGSIIAKSDCDYTNTLILVRIQAPTAELHPDHFQEWYSDFWYTCYLLYKSSYVYVPYFLRHFGCKKGKINCPCAEMCKFFFKRRHLFTSLAFFFYVMIPVILTGQSALNILKAIYVYKICTFHYLHSLICIQ